MFGGYHPAEHRSITRRRAQEDSWNNAVSEVQRTKLIMHKTNWEENTAKQMKRNTLVNIARTQKANDRARLLERRERLARKLEEEQQQYRVELASLQETSDQRAARLIDRAKKLKADREARTKIEVQKTYERQWREGCDDLRTIESDRFLMHCHEEVARQRIEKANRKELERMEEKRWSKMWEQSRQTSIKREQKERQEKQAALHDNRNALLAQMAESRRIRAEQARKNARDRSIFQKQMEKDAEDARREQARRISEHRQMARETKAFNQRALQMKRAAVQRQRDEEKRILEKQRQALEDENKQNAVDKASKREEIRRYRDFLRAQKESDRQAEVRIDKLIQADLDKSNRKRDMQRQKEENKRTALAKTVRQTLAHQIQQKARKEALHAEQVRREREDVMEKTRRELDAVALEEKQERDRAYAHRKDLEKQIQEQRMKKNLATAHIQLDREFAEQAEAQYRTFLTRERQKDRSYTQRKFGLKDSAITKHSRHPATTRGYAF